MTPGRLWSDPAAESEFWRLMEDYEAGHAAMQRVGIWAALTSPLRRRSAVRHLDGIRRRAEDLVRRHTVPAIATDETAAPPATASDDRSGVHPALLIAATLANDPRPNAETDLRRASRSPADR